MFSDIKLAIIDCETTGLRAGVNEIIEIGLLIYDQQTDKVELEWERKIKPTNLKTASQKALDMNGYNKNPEAYVGDLEETLNELNDVVADAMIVGQNTQFDLSFIMSDFDKFKIRPKFFPRRYLDTMILCWPYVRKTDMDKLSLEALCNHFGISNEGAHGALADCKRTLEVYRKLMGLYG